VGTWGHFAAFSFYPTKNLGAVGDGGMLVINAKAAEETLTCSRRMRFYGWDDHREAVQFGINSRLDELQAWILAGKLADLDGQIQARRTLADLYRSGLSGLAAEGVITLPGDGDLWRHSYHLFVIQVEADQRDSLLQRAAQMRIPLGVHYSKACHQHPYIIRTIRPQSHLPNTEAVVDRVLSLPINPSLTEDDVVLVCDFLSNHLRR
jgi:dTDP-4-amino-4,6-dideoxygalactose transaminase